jgi:hypothetical protein
MFSLIPGHKKNENKLNIRINMNKRSLIGLFLVIIFSLKVYSQNEYYSFLKSNYCEPKEYVNKLFETKDLIILCERDHREITQYDFLFELVSQPWFISNVGVIIMEVPSQSVQPQIDELLLSENLTPDELNAKLRSIYQDMMYVPLWSNTNFYYFLKNVYTLNQSLKQNEKIRVVCANVKFSWSEIQTKKDFDDFNKAIYNSRDKDMADLIIDWYSKSLEEKKRSKALIIMNYRHSYTNKLYTSSNIHLTNNTARYIKEAFPEKVTNIYLHSYTFWKFLSLERHHEKGKWDKAFKENKNLPIGFKLENSPFGRDHFDHYPYIKTDLKWVDVFDHLVFYNPIKEFRISQGIKGIVDGKFEKELKRRYDICGHKLTKKKILRYNTERSKKVIIW